MRRLLFILLTGAVLSVMADDFIDDVYYTPQLEVEKRLESGKVSTPYYNKGAREIIFIEDTTSGQPVDTVRAVIREVL